MWPSESQRVSRALLRELARLRAQEGAAGAVSADMLSAIADGGKAKVGRNPKDPGKDVPIPPRAVVKFKPGKEMKEKVARILPAIQQQAQVDLPE